jgi:hypothetical protein
MAKVFKVLGRDFRADKDEKRRMLGKGSDSHCLLIEAETKPTKYANFYQFPQFTAS